jgi:hypothetical protein
VAFIVSLFKYLILGACFLMLTGIALFVFAAIDPNGPMQGLATPYAIGGVLIAVVFMILNLGAIAILISLHDRHKEIASGVHRVAEAIEQSNASKQKEG